MKMRAPHIVPLSRQAAEILREIHLLTGIKILPSALEDLDRGRRFYARQGKSVGDYFLDCRQEPEKTTGALK
jgi:integrase